MKWTPSFLPILLCLFGNSLFAQTIQLEELAGGFNNIVKIASTGEDDRLFVLERSGRIEIIDATGTKLATPFLDIDAKVSQTGGQSEQGLLGLAFHPDYANNGYFFVNYTDNSGTTIVSRFRVSAMDPNIADATSETNIMSISQPFGNHNGGEIEFGPDGYLYVGMGDGGAGNDPQHLSQNPQSLLGKMLRIDINGALPYTIPADNPFVNTADTLSEIWALGLRNPWRFSFDRETGDLWMADVGQWDKEEIDFQPANSTGGENYGWRCREGSIDNPNVGDNGCGPAAGYVEPVYEYSHTQFGPCSITGGFVYRACRYPAINGYYLYADYCSGDIWGLSKNAQGEWENTTLLTIGTGAWTTFGQDAKGELYVAGLNGGKVFHITSGDAVEDIVIAEDMGEYSVAGGFFSYQWYFNGNPIMGANTRSYTPTESGEYYVEAMHSGGCVFQSNTINHVVTSLGTLTDLTGFQVLPNPFQDKVNLALTTEKPSEFLLKVYTVDGRQVFEKVVEGNGTWNTTIDLSDLQSAVYMLHLSSGTEELTHKLIKE